METKKCNECNQEKAIDNFSKKGSGRTAKCKKCMIPLRKLDYESNKAYYIKKSAKHNKIYGKRNLQHMIDFLKKHPCIDCGETDPIVLEFDHIANKNINVSAMVKSYSIKLIDEEIAKCEVRCANCHRKKTAIQLDWYKDIDITMPQ